MTSLPSTPTSHNFNSLYENFIAYIAKADLHINPYNAATDQAFAALMEAIAPFLSFPANEEEFTEGIDEINQIVKEKIKRLAETKTTLPEKSAEYARLLNEHDSDLLQKGPQLLFEIILAEAEIRRFLFFGTKIPLCYMLYFIAVDEFHHFSPMVRQAALQSLRRANKDFLWKKFCELRGDYFDTYPVYVPFLPGSSISEFARAIVKALELLGYEYEYQTIETTASAVFETMPGYREFLYKYPLTISNAKGEAVLSNQQASLAYRAFHDVHDPSRGVKRFIEILDYTLPNSRGIPAALFRQTELALPFIRREYLRYKGIENEAELCLCAVQDKYAPPSFIRAQNPRKARDLVLTYMTFLELYASPDDTFESPNGSAITRADISMFLEKEFDLSALTQESLLHAKIMLWYVEPIQSIFNIAEATEASLSQINQYIESVYGKPLSAEAAKEKALEFIAKENEHIADLNRELEGEENQWKPLQEGSHQWNTLYAILLRQYTRRHTLTMWELKGILYDIKTNTPDMKPRLHSSFLIPNSSFFQRTLSKALQSYEDSHPAFIKARKRLYDYFYDKLDAAEKKLDACGWQEFKGECLRLDRNCCTIPYSNPCLTPTGCNCKPLSCKFWLCSAARCRLSETRQGRSLLSKRRLYNWWCVAFNIPLKLRCSRANAFDEKAIEPFIDISAPDWFDKPMSPKTPDPPAAVSAKRGRNRRPPKTPEKDWRNPSELLNKPPKPLDPKKYKLKRKLQYIVLAILLLLILLW